jgi:hypothetical protein
VGVSRRTQALGLTLLVGGPVWLVGGLTCQGWLSVACGLSWLGCGAYILYIDRQAELARRRYLELLEILEALRDESSLM